MGWALGKKWLICGMTALLTVLWQRVCVCVKVSVRVRECHAKGFGARKMEQKITVLQRHFIGAEW